MKRPTPPSLDEGCSATPSTLAHHRNQYRARARACRSDCPRGAHPHATSWQPPRTSTSGYMVKVPISNSWAAVSCLWGKLENFALKHLHPSSDSHRAMPADRVILTASTSEAEMLKRDIRNQLYLDMMNQRSLAAVIADTFSHTCCATSAARRG